MKFPTKLLLTAAMLTLTAGAYAQDHMKSLDPNQVDASISPKADFYGYVNSKWQKANPLTDEYSRYGKFNILSDSSQNRVKRIVMGLADQKPAMGTNAQKVSTIYNQAMDMDRRNSLGAKPIQDGIKKIENTPASGMEDLFIWMQKEYASPFVAGGPSEDMKNSNAYAMYVSGAGLGLGDRDYYLLNDKRNKEILTAYKKLIVDQMMNAGLSKKAATRVMNNVIKYETELAKDTWTREESRNTPAMYNPRSFAELKQLYPHMPWDRYFIETMEIPSPETVIVTELKTVAKGDDLYSKMTDREKKDLYLWKYVAGAAPYLSEAFTNASFEFNKVMSGVKEQRPLWKRALGATEGALGEAIGELYVEKYFTPEAKEYMIGLIENLRTSLGKHILNLGWMSDDTKLRAIKKLNAITVKVGYPDKWEDYSTLIIDPQKSYYDNMHEVSKWSTKKELAKYGKPVDKTKWGMTPQTVNAYYNPMANEIVFPAAILQAPFFDFNASDAENYGGIGVVIGHEMTHGFDDQGCNFDENGNLTNWWTPEDAEAFAKLGKGLVAQFDEIEVLPGLHANGTYTLGENIADHGGLRVAYTAFLDSQKKKGVDINSAAAKIDGFTPAQTFYMNYANLWGQNIRPEEMRSLTTGDVHSLGEWRVNMSLRNITPFFEAFDIKEGDPMFRPESERLIIW